MPSVAMRGCTVRTLVSQLFLQIHKPTVRELHQEGITLDGRQAERCQTDAGQLHPCSLGLQ